MVACQNLPGVKLWYATVSKRADVHMKTALCLTYLPVSNNASLKKGLRLQVLEIIIYCKPVLRDTSFETAG